MAAPARRSVNRIDVTCYPVRVAHNKLSNQSAFALSALTAIALV
jgi:hypothetical protein